MNANKLTLKILRWLENFFYDIGAYFEDYADAIDVEFHETLRQALNKPVTGVLLPQSVADEIKQVEMQARNLQIPKSILDQLENITKQL